MLKVSLASVSPSLSQFFPVFSSFAIAVSSLEMAWVNVAMLFSFAWYCLRISFLLCGSPFGHLGTNMESMSVSSSNSSLLSSSLILSVS